ncbi:MAG: hypothetical protein IPN76_33800 [Saprospiraceae bacterium]|nr:hypothetical protein [Saprospiraceae bacterium]
MSRVVQVNIGAPMVAATAPGMALYSRIFRNGSWVRVILGSVGPVLDEAAARPLPSQRCLAAFQSAGDRDDGQGNTLDGSGFDRFTKNSRGHPCRRVAFLVGVFGIHLDEVRVLRRIRFAYQVLDGELLEIGSGCCWLGALSATATGCGIAATLSVVAHSKAN